MDIDNDGICNTFDKFVWEPAASKINSYASATEAATQVLCVDETVRNPQSEGAARAMGRGRGGRAPPGGGMSAVSECLCSFVCCSFVVSFVFSFVCLDFVFVVLCFVFWILCVGVVLYILCVVLCLWFWILFCVGVLCLWFCVLDLCVGVLLVWFCLCGFLCGFSLCL